MVLKTKLVQPGWSYGNDDDQYDNESLGSTKTALNLENSVKNPMKNKKNEHDEKICSKQGKQQTDDQGWTTIDANGKRKPRTTPGNSTSIDSIISSIDVEFKRDTNGTLEAKIDSPTRENRCTVPDKNVYETEGKKSTQATKKHEHQGEDKSTKETKHRNTKMETSRAQTIDKKTEEMKKQLGITSAEEEDTKPRLVKMAASGQSEETRMRTVTGTSSISKGTNNNNTSTNAEEEQSDKNNKNTNRNSNGDNNSNNNGNNNRQRVSICAPGEMETYTFTISWRPEDKAGVDGKMIIKSLMREMQHRTPQIVFHPTNSTSSPVPRDIHIINTDFPTTSASFDDFFDQMRNRGNTNQRTFMKVSMPHDEKELQRKLHNYLFHNKLYMNSPFIDDNTLEQVGFIENGHSRLLYRPTLELKIRNGLKEVMEGNRLSPQQVAQLKNLSSSIRVECHRGTVRAGPYQQQVVCEGIVLKTAKSQSKIAMELLSMLPDTLLGEYYRIIPKSLGNLLGYELYGRIVADTVNFQDTLRPITLMACHPSVFEDMYSVNIQNSSTVTVSKFISECCGAISIEETNETKEKGKYIVVVPEGKVDSARAAIGTMFQEFQQSGGRPAAMACLTEYKTYPLVNDSVTISGHAQLLSERIRSRYQNRPKTPIKKHHSSASYSYHGSTPGTSEQNLPTPQTPVPRSIRGIVKGKQTINSSIRPTQQWPATPIAQRQPTTTPTNQGEDRTVMSNLSPDDSAKTMMTNVSKMVESLGTVVTTMAKETANTNETMKQMMIQQATTMNNLMMIMTRNEDRRQGTPISISEIQPVIDLQQGSTPASTLTNSQYSLSQEQLPSSNKRPKHGLNDDETNRR
ncbi:hypothetical protein FRACYDRAFT_249207 [Fragilariopsis cylindrus CCMP1102]|uniref:Uncharacterized protein n=1 Tax=Fragilariopsis cylindrus CCMP1102 TaxID=635003 RepID=A0A1E7ESK9_9STRA|nr:hypothetical protein FRACYDRAFT_249207 [Fragilariopsis cylindrus CCMP1102]|eukprot:OEU08862.1 hypothetical protein FRACYDRAFT_249207 [Fragilariopsis cylindrus CCMP1102]